MAAFKYKVQAGDNLSALAKKFDLPSWSTIYHDSSNANFRKKRPDPNVILVGDEVMIPDPPGGYNFSLPDPPYVEQKNTWWCWAAAMESWLVVTPGRTSISQTALRTKFSQLTDPNNGGLTIPGWVALAKEYNMEGQSFTNPTELQLRGIHTILKEKGFIVLVYQIVSGGASHVNVLYGLQSSGGETMLKVMDPQQDNGGLMLRPLSFYSGRSFVGLLWAQ